MFPEHKYRIVRLLQTRGHIVGMTGDGSTTSPRETIRVLLLITVAIVFMNFFPVTAVMIVFLAVLNDGAILSIAYDHVRGSPKPVKWDMRVVLTIATAQGVIGVVATFVLFFLADQVFGLSHDMIRTVIYLKLSVAGHLTTFLTRARGPFWSRPASAPILLAAVFGTRPSPP